MKRIISLLVVICLFVSGLYASPADIELSDAYLNCGSEFYYDCMYLYDSFTNTEKVSYDLIEGHTHDGCNEYGLFEFSKNKGSLAVLFYRGRSENEICVITIFKFTDR